MEECQKGQCGSCPFDGQYVCHCLRITEEQILAVIESGCIANLMELRATTQAGTGCMACHGRLKDYLERTERRRELVMA